jgi:acyl dehydratase
MLAFAQLYDPQEMHLNRVWAEESGPFGGLIASGFLTLCVAWWLFLRLGLVAASMYVGIGVNELRWLRPVRAGETLSLQVEVLDKSAAPREKRGRVTFIHRLFNQEGEVVMTYETLNLILLRPE